MKKIEIYDPAMCCSTGVCGPSVDTELLRVATIVDSLKKQGADITRYNLSSEPQAFISNKDVNNLLTEDNDILPITIVDGQIVKTKSHLTNDEFYKYTGILIVEVDKPTNNGCCGGDSGCC
ncbi:arsenite efflux transporter metallochaperone ArsD [Asaccharospora irregularis]|uniref:Arsenical resistance operon trans-acting repressor ArsD n=1 Tax=Asaccharospora irregularis DSM 2635 TaxID=1121321 RepID=A0A1M5SCM5_9FIRM|nr:MULTISPECIES: arsenite efflux transporter metallochaperone ArsD [Peptostreptococcaceae]SHH36266.1 Arsenical resistance operon trans-acting repressor ArsD [Asaccharospora irregularis DSM 2635]